MLTDFTTQRLLKAFHSASNQAQGAAKLYQALTNTGREKNLHPADSSLALAFCDELEAAAKIAQAEYQAHVALALEAEAQRVAAEAAATRQRRANAAAPITPLDQFNAAAYEAQQRGISHMQAVAA